MMDAVLNNADTQLNEGNVDKALGTLMDGFNRIGNALKKHGLSLETIMSRVSRVRGIADKASRRFGAYEYTVEVGVTSILSIGFHFKSNEELNLID